MAKPATQQKKGANSTQSSNPSKNSQGAGRNWRLIMALVVAVLGFIAYSNTLNHSYVLDDFSVIKENSITQGGVKNIGKIFSTSYRGGQFDDASGLYRPLSRVMFAVEWQIAPNSPSLSHWINVLFYAFACGLLFFVFYEFLKPNYIVPFVAALLFALHPIHTEVVANIKSRDEILALIFLLTSLYSIKRFVQSDSVPFLLLGILSYFLALLSKESSITFLALIPFTIWFFVKDSLKRNLMAGAALLVVTAVYLMIHINVVGNIGVSNVPVVDNSLFATDSKMVQVLTAVYTLGLYLKLLVFPHPLSCDYSYNQIPLIDSAGDGGFIISLLIHCALFVFAIRQLPKRSIYSYGILFYIITLSIGANIVVLIGTNMAERLLFIPSIGFTLSVAQLLVHLFKYPATQSFAGWNKMFRQSSVMFILIAVILFLSIGKTYSRNKDWKNVSTLFRQDIKTVPNSAHMRLYYAGMITNEDSLALKTPQQKVATLQDAINNLNVAVKIYDQFPDAHNQLGKCYKELGNFPEAEKHYLKCVELAGENATYHNNLGTVYFVTGRYQLAEREFKKGVELNPGCYPDALCNLGSVYGTYGELSRGAGQPDTAVKYFRESLVWFNKTLECDPYYQNAIKFAAATYRSLGDEASATAYDRRLQEAITREQRMNKSK